MARNKSQYQRFDNVMRELVRVPHSKIKAKLEAERAARKRGPRGPSASRDSGGRT
jgi:hypothetical protein